MFVEVLELRTGPVGSSAFVLLKLLLNFLDSCFLFVGKCRNYLVRQRHQ